MVSIIDFSKEYFSKRYALSYNVDEKKNNDASESKWNKNKLQTIHTSKEIFPKSVWIKKNTQGTEKTVFHFVSRSLLSKYFAESWILVYLRIRSHKEPS